MFQIIIGTTDITNYVAKGGIEWSKNDVDGSNAGRAINGLMIRDKIAVKDKIKVTCRPLHTSELNNLLAAIESEYLSVQFTNPRTGSLTTKTMYCSTVPAAFLLSRAQGEDLWSGIAFNLIER